VDRRDVHRKVSHQKHRDASSLKVYEMRVECSLLSDPAVIFPRPKISRPLQDPRVGPVRAMMGAQREENIELDEVDSGRQGKYSAD